MSFTIELEGFEDIDAELVRMAKAAPEASAKALTDSTLHLLGEAVQAAPVDLGELRGSGSAIVNGAVVGRGTKDGGVIGGGSAPASSGNIIGEVRFTQRYAAVQHERLDYHHPRGGQAKYLEQPLEANRQRYLQHLRDSVRGEIE